MILLNNNDKDEINKSLIALKKEQTEQTTEQINRELAKVKEELSKVDKGGKETTVSITVGSTTTGDAGTSAKVENVGTDVNAIFDFTIPRGEKGLKGDNGTNGKDGKDGTNGTNGIDGKAATIEVAGTQTLPPDQTAFVENQGTANAARFLFGIPQGQQGIQGLKGKDGKDGTNGIDGITPNCQATATTGAEGTEATVNRTGTDENPVFNFTIPRGDTPKFINADAPIETITQAAWNNFYVIGKVDNLQNVSNWELVKKNDILIFRYKVRIKSSDRYNSGYWKVTEKPTSPTINNAILISKVDGGEQGEQGERGPAGQMELPIDWVYTQWPGEKSPLELWPNQEWRNISANYAGAFVRVDGGNAKAFGTGRQAESLPNITGKIFQTNSNGGAISAAYYYSGALCPADKNGIVRQDNPQTVSPIEMGIKIDSSLSSPVYSNAVGPDGKMHNTPENYAVRVWKRFG